MWDDLIAKKAEWIGGRLVDNFLKLVPGHVNGWVTHADIPVFTQDREFLDELIPKHPGYEKGEEYA